HAFSTLRRLYFASTLLLLYAGIPPAKAQSPTPDSLIRYKWEIATDLLWLIDKNTVPRFSVFGRMNITTKNGKHRAWRLRLATDFSKVDSSQINGTVPTDMDRFGIYSQLGYEWQKTEKKFCWFYGTDFLFEYESLKHRAIGVINKTGSNFDIWTMGLTGFLGIKYFIHPRFSISGETNFQFTYNSFKRTGFATGLNSPDFTGTQSAENRSEWNFTFQPLYVLNLGFHF
ncbi:MAG: hypothetical protein HC913_13535, partial [Microscillaceae bacterium]|nr:hypothetical protein [Microscillaceae bacterium]